MGALPAAKPSATRPKGQIIPEKEKRFSIVDRLQTLLLVYLRRNGIYFDH